MIADWRRILQLPVVATRLAQSKHRVLRLEKEHLPRFHYRRIDAPLHDAVDREQLGALPRSRAADSLPNAPSSAEIADGSLKRRYLPMDSAAGSEPLAFEVDRSEFDKLFARQRAAGVALTCVKACKRLRFDIDRGAAVNAVARR